MKKNIFAIIMAGGGGERFWPIGRRDKPKQFSNIADGDAMIVSTYKRLSSLFLPENLFVITNIRYVSELQKMLPIPPENIIGEPVGRDTAPCVALATALVKRRDPNAVMVLLPADHLIQDEQRFCELVSEAIDVATVSEYLITLGIVPDYPADCYGYIEAGEKSFGEFQKVKRFLEKPDTATAVEFCKTGGFYWNCGIFIWSVKTIEREFNKHCPDLSVLIDDLIEVSDIEEYLAENFWRCQKISIDYAVMEKAEAVLVRKADFQWNDVGSLSALKKVFSQDENGNAISGNAVVLDSHNCVIRSDSGNLIGVIGMKNAVVVQAGNGVLVYPLALESQVKALVRQLPDYWK